MNAQQLEYVRIKLLDALEDDSGSMKGQLEAFEEYSPADRNRNPRQKVHIVELDNCNGGVRRVKAEKKALNVTETRSRRRPMPPIKEYTYSLCAWRRAVLTLSLNEQAWIEYCYNYNLDFRLQTVICNNLWRLFLYSLKNKNIRRKTIENIAPLVWLAVQEVAATNRGEINKSMPGSVLAGLLKIKRQTWHAIYAKHWAHLKRLCEQIDEHSLKKIIKKI